MDLPLKPPSQTYNIITSTITDHDDDIFIKYSQNPSITTKHQALDPDLYAFRQFQKSLKNRKPPHGFPDNQDKDDLKTFCRFQQFQSFLAFK